MLRERAERVAVAAYQADRTAGLIRGVEDEPMGVAERMAVWERWLTHDPADTDEARADARMRELMEEAA